MDGSPSGMMQQFESNVTAAIAALQDGGEVLTCPTLRGSLEPRPSPFLVDNYHGGGFVSDEDRVDLQAVHFASRKSAGSRSQGKLDELLRTTGATLALPKSALRSGPRETIYHSPPTTQVASEY